MGDFAAGYTQLVASLFCLISGSNISTSSGGRRLTRKSNRKRKSKGGRRKRVLSDLDLEGKDNDDEVCFFKKNFCFFSFFHVSFPIECWWGKRLPLWGVERLTDSQSTVLFTYPFLVHTACPLSLALSSMIRIFGWLFPSRCRHSRAPRSVLDCVFQREFSFGARSLCSEIVCSGCCCCCCGRRMLARVKHHRWDRGRMLLLFTGRVVLSSMTLPITMKPRAMQWMFLEKRGESTNPGYFKVWPAGFFYQELGG